MKEKLDRKHFLMVLPAALVALIKHKEEAEPTVILENITVNQSETGQPVNISHCVVHGRPGEAGIKIDTSKKIKLKDHPRAAEIREKMGE